MSRYIVERSQRSKWEYDVVFQGRPYARCEIESVAHKIADALNEHREPEGTKSEALSRLLIKIAKLS